MDRTIEIGRAGLQNTEDRMQALMEGVVNAATPGYRRVDLLTRGFPLELQAAEARLYESEWPGAQPLKPVTEGTAVNYERGHLQPTGRPTDLALDGDGFFVLLAPWGESYTRDGRFQLDPNGQLISVSTGWPLLGDNGPIVSLQGQKLDISSNGVIRLDGVEVDRLRVVRFENSAALESVSGALLRSSGQGNPGIIPADAVSVVQGFVEQSNVETIGTSMDLLLLSRIYQYDTRVLQIRDQLLGRAMELPRPAQ